MLRGERGLLYRAILTLNESALRRIPYTGMKILPVVALLTCAALLAACSPPQADKAEVEKQVQERLDEEHQAQQQRELHEREAALDEQERLLKEREQALAAATPAVAEAAVPEAPVAAAPDAGGDSADATYQEFYDSLSPYGSWINMPGYGYVWQPWTTVQDANWRPYTVGHWAYTDDGWAWVSDEKFGWVTYHYGRWMRTHTLGWVWVPGDQWAPAWVSWRYGNEYVGWAPLPPEARFDGAAGIQQWADQQYSLGASDYTFVPASDFGDESMASAAIPPDDDAAIFDDSNNVTNIYYDTASYAIICYGPSYEFMRSKSRRPLPPQLRIARNGFRGNGQNGGRVDGNTLQVTAPRIVKGRTAGAPRKVASTVVDARLTADYAPRTARRPAVAAPVLNAPLPGAGEGGTANRPTQPFGNGARTPGGAGEAGLNPSLPGAQRDLPYANPARVPQADTEVSGNPPPPAPGGMRIPSGLNPRPLPQGVQDQKARDLQLIDQARASEAERQRKQAANAEQAATERAGADDNAVAQREAAARAAAEQGAAERAAANRAEAERAAADRMAAQRAQAEQLAAQQQAARAEAEAARAAQAQGARQALPARSPGLRGQQ